MTNKEWLDHLANNSPGELAAWFAAEHDEPDPVKEFVGQMQRITKLCAQRDEARRQCELYREKLGECADLAEQARNVAMGFDEGLA